MNDASHPGELAEAVVRPPLWKRFLRWATTMSLLMLVSAVLNNVLVMFKANLHAFNESTVLVVQSVQAARLLHVFGKALFAFNRVEVERLNEQIKDAQSELEGVEERIRKRREAEEEQDRRDLIDAIRPQPIDPDADLLSSTKRSGPFAFKLPPSLDPLSDNMDSSRVDWLRIKLASLRLQLEKAERGSPIQPIPASMHLFEAVAEMGPAAIGMAVIALLLGAALLASLEIKNAYVYLFGAPLLGMCLIWLLLQTMILGGHLLGWLMPAAEATTGINAIASAFVETAGDDYKGRYVTRLIQAKNRWLDTAIDWVSRRFAR